MRRIEIVCKCGTRSIVDVKPSKIIVCPECTQVFVLIGDQDAELYPVNTEVIVEYEVTEW